MSSNIVWRLCALEEPSNNGVYEVRLERNDDHISPTIETIMEYKNGEWLMRVPQFINEYHVHSWRIYN